MLRWLFILAVVLSAFLLFLVQPLMGRFVLPWFGGSHVVWTACLLFFQVALLAGYAYAHWANSLLKQKAAWVHLGLLGACLLFLPLIPGDWLRPSGEASPVWGVLRVLVLVVGLPYLTLSTTGPLLQAWFSKLFPDRSPYRLFALSNLGSLIGLFAYPFLVEPWLTRTEQAWGWSGAFVLFAIACGSCAWAVTRLTSTQPTSANAHSRASSLTGAAATNEEPWNDELAEIIEQRRAQQQAKSVPEYEHDSPIKQRWPLWIALAMVPSMTLVATSSQLSQEVAAVPFLWTMPLGLYLLSFVICFDHPRWYMRPLWMVLCAVGLLAAEFAVWTALTLAIVTQITLLGAGLFTACMVCHGELARLKPHPQHLTFYYLCLSIGGALGGLFVGVIAPLIFFDYWELAIAYLLVPMVAGFCLLIDASRPVRWVGGISLATLLPLWALVLWIEMSGHQGEFLKLSRQQGVIAAAQTVFPKLNQVLKPGVIFRGRDEYGVLTVQQRETGTYLYNGRIMHGMQVANPDGRHPPLSYYGPSSGLSLAIEALRAGQDERRSEAASNNELVAEDMQTPEPLASRNGLRMSVVGLGTGVAAAFTEPGDSMVFYEIHPRVEDVAREYFDYLKEAQGPVEVRIGDARITMERELAQGAKDSYDLIAIDAFSSDAIPQHLLTSEAFDVYEGQLAPSGIMAFHVSNRFLRLGIIVRNLSRAKGWHSLRIHDGSPETKLCQSSDWILVARDAKDLERVIVTSQLTKWSDNPEVEILWTDDFGSLWQVLIEDSIR